MWKVFNIVMLCDSKSAPEQSHRVDKDFLVTSEVKPPHWWLEGFLPRGSATNLFDSLSEKKLEGLAVILGPY